MSLSILKLYYFLFLFHSYIDFMDILCTLFSTRKLFRSKFMQLWCNNVDWKHFSLMPSYSHRCAELYTLHTITQLLLSNHKTGINHFLFT